MIDEKDFISFLSIKLGASDQTIRHCTIRLRVIEKWFALEQKELSKISIEGFFFALKQKGLGNAALNTYLLCFQYIEQYLKDRDRPVVLLEGFKAFPKIRLKPIDILSQEEVERLLAVSIPYKPFRGKDSSFLDFVYRTFTMSLAYTGARFSEMALLKVMYVDLTWGRIIFNATTTKTKTERRVFITEPLLGMLRVLVKDKKPGDLVFQNMMGNQIREQEYSKDIKARGELAKIEKRIHPHLLRHTYATHLYIATRDIGLVQVVLGHKDIKSTMIYIQIAEDVIKNGMYTHPFIRLHVDPLTTISALEDHLDTLKLDTDPRFDPVKIRELQAAYINGLHQAVVKEIL